VHDRALLYYRLLKHAEPEAARGTLVAESSALGSFAESLDDKVNDTLFLEFNSLSVLYRRPAATFAAATAAPPLLQGARPLYPARSLSLTQPPPSLQLNALSVTWAPRRNCLQPLVRHLVAAADVERRERRKAAHFEPIHPAGALNVTQRALSVTQRGLSVSQRALSVSRRGLSVRRRAL
jgi:hypothetical protein